MSTITPEEEKRYAELQRMALEAARQGDEAMLGPMLEAGMPVELKDEKGNTLLMLAAYHGHAALVKILLGYGADAEARNDRGQKPLAGVAFKGHVETAEVLLEGGADPLADQGGGRYPVMFAAMFGQREMVKLLERAAEGRGVRKKSLGWMAALMVWPRKWILEPMIRRRKRQAEAARQVTG